MKMRENAGEITLCGNVREKRAKCGSLPPNAGGLATMACSLCAVQIGGAPVPGRGERAGTSLSNTKIVVISSGARLCVQ